MPDSLDLARALQGIETPTPVSGTAGLVIRFDGPLETWRTGSATLDVTALDAMAGNLALRLAARRRCDTNASASSSTVSRWMPAKRGSRRSGDLDAFEPARAGAGVLVTLTGEVAEVARAVAATGLTDVPVQGGTGPVALLARVNGSLESPRRGGRPRARSGLGHAPGPAAGLGARRCARTRRTDGWSCAKAPLRTRTPASRSPAALRCRGRCSSAVGAAGRCRDPCAGDEPDGGDPRAFRRSDDGGAARRLGGCHARCRERHTESVRPDRRIAARSPRRPHRRSARRPAHADAHRRARRLRAGSRRGTGSGRAPR